MHPAQLIHKKRHGGELTEAEVTMVAAGAADGSFGDAQLGAFLMAVCLQGMTVAETRALTLAMRDSGKVLDLGVIPGRKVDKHSTGGVGDKVSLVLAPLVAACGVPVPMISGRGLGHTGGTLDKLQSIPGYRTDLSEDEFVQVLRDGGFVMAGASADVAPADRRMYAIRDVSGTVDSVPLITASILSKKLAEGIDGLVLDVKCGRAAFMQTEVAARELMQSLVATGRAAGIDVRALLTDMDTPLGLALGNAVEVRESIDTLRGEGPADLWEVTRELGAEMLIMAGAASDLDTGRRQMSEALESGAGLARLRRNIELQGGDVRVVDDPDRLGRAACDLEVLSPADGYVADWNPLTLGLAVVDLGSGRRQPTDAVDAQVGIVLRKRVGQRVHRDEPVAKVFSRDVRSMQHAIESVAAALTVSAEAPSASPLILDRV